ncbi:D-alanyl-D-alanine carboxypeptidase [Candidatus Falkowbacteria bacterium]|nr:D-alanyl-D-alanine carboxypeptidase [Candidatus Falkowbacteria bacterium]
MILKAALIFLLTMSMGSLAAQDIVPFQKGGAAEPQKIVAANIGVKVTAKKFIVIDVASGKILFAKNAAEQQPIASITKLMTSLVVLEQNPNWKKEVEMIVADETIGAAPHIYRGEKVTFYDLWKTALIASDNNAIKAMLRALGLKESEFVALMNDKAREIGLLTTEFSDPTGLDEGNKSSAIDVAKLLHYALQQNGIREMVLQRSYEFKILNKKIKSRKIFTTDFLLASFLNNPAYGYELFGGKTGYTIEAGFCLVVELAKNDHQIIIVVLDSASLDDRFNDVKVLADWVYENYKWK